MLAFSLLSGWSVARPDRRHAYTLTSGPRFGATVPTRLHWLGMRVGAVSGSSAGTTQAAEGTGTLRTILGFVLRVGCGGTGLHAKVFSRGRRDGIDR